MKKKYLYLGLLGPLIMYIGDMLLYYTPNDFNHEEFFMIMKDVSDWRLILGGYIGPLAGFFYLFGFYHIYSHMNKGILNKLFLGIHSLAIIFGASYHAQFANLGLMTKVGQEAFDATWAFSSTLLMTTLLLYIIGSIIFVVVVARGRSEFKKSIIIFTPLILLMLSPLLSNILPQPYLILINGGWYNIVFFIFFIASNYLTKEKLA